MLAVRDACGPNESRSRLPKVARSSPRTEVNTIIRAHRNDANHGPYVGVQTSLRSPSRARSTGQHVRHIVHVLGGLLSTYHLQSSLFLDKAIDLAYRIMPIFAKPSGSCQHTLFTVVERCAVGHSNHRTLVNVVGSVVYRITSATDIQQQTNLGNKNPDTCMPASSIQRKE